MGIDRNNIDKIFEELKNLRKLKIISRDTYLFFLENSAVDYHFNHGKAAYKTDKIYKFNLN